MVNPSPREKGGCAVAATPAAGALGATAKPAIAAAGGRAPKATNEERKTTAQRGAADHIVSPRGTRTTAGHQFAVNIGGLDRGRIWSTRGSHGNRRSLRLTWSGPVWWGGGGGGGEDPVR